MTANKTKALVTDGLLTALVFIGSLIGFHSPSVTGGGYIHLGTAVMFFSAFVFGSRSAALAGGIGMGLFDLFGGYTLWAPFTFIISFCMGYTAGKTAYTEDRRLNVKNCIAAFTLCTFIKVGGYYITEVILYKSFISPLASIPGNITQMIAGILGGSLIASAFLKQKRILKNV